MEHGRGFSFSLQELYELFSAWVILSVAFAILYSGTDLSIFIIVFAICLFTVGLGFALHEIGHKLLAQRYGLQAFFKANFQGLGLAVLMSFLGFVYVAPGAVQIFGGRITREQLGRISLIGPLMNLLLGVGFLALLLSPAREVWILGFVFSLGYRINVWIGLFNLIPMQPFDGADIKNWSFPLWLFMVIFTGSLYLLSYLL